MHLLVIGGSGFIGRHFVRHAHEAGHRVTIVSRSPSTGDGGAGTVIAGGMEALCRNGELLDSADVVCHLASSTIPSSSHEDPLADVRSNVLGTLELLEAMRRSACRRILFLSSGGAVYGVPKYTPMDEDHPTNPISPYGVGKLAIEKYLGVYMANHGFRPAIIRPSNPYGPDQGKLGQLGAVWTFLNCALNGQPATLFGDGSTVRDFVYVDDLCRLMLACIERDAIGTFNCGGGDGGTSLSELVATIEKISGKPLSLDRRPSRPYDPQAVVLDISRAQAQLGWQPEISLEVGIAKLLK